MGTLRFLDPVLAGRTVGSTLSVAEKLARWPAGRLTVLTYHRIDEIRSDGRDPSLVSCTPTEFDHQVQYLQERCELVSLSDVANAQSGRSKLPERAVLLTFDDGVDDFRTHALPVLRRYGAPGVVFLPTGFVDDPSAWFWWDAVYAALVTTTSTSLSDSVLGPLTLGSTTDRRLTVRRLRAALKERPWSELLLHVERMCEELEVEPPRANVMSWSAVEEVAALGIDVCAHTRTHPHLDQVPIEIARDEITGSIDDLRSRVGIVSLAFAYPSGRWSRAVVDLMVDCGVELAFSTQNGSHRIGFDDPLLVRRINVTRRTGFNAARAFMHPWADLHTGRRAAEVGA